MNAHAEISTDINDWTDTSFKQGSKARLLYGHDFTINGVHFHVEAIRVLVENHTQIPDSDPWAAAQFTAMEQIDTPDGGFAPIRIGRHDYVLNLLPIGR